jgi:ubiquinone/menaquinone biosynthesis C-methylase UbiE
MMIKEDLIVIYNRRAQKILKMKSKRVLGRKYRQKLLQNASGKILEVAVGAGTNFGFYPAGAELVAVDFSPVLLDMAKKAAAENKLTAEFINFDVEALSFPENSFDTIVSTLSLCAYDDPVKLLGKFGHWCKPGGYILLFEHGLSSSNLLNRFLCKFDGWNYRKNGCHLNRDIVRTVEAAGIVIEKVEVVMFGAHYLIWGRPGKDAYRL